MSDRRPSLRNLIGPGLGSGEHLAAAHWLLLFDQGRLSPEEQSDVRARWAVLEDGGPTAPPSRPGAADGGRPESRHGGL